jgi:hypothetical protein
MGIKTQNFTLMMNPLKKFFNNAPRKSLTNMTKSGESAYFRHVFANNFFWCNFLKLFQRIQNQREIQRLDTHYRY